jgi:hypothetical protein
LKIGSGKITGVGEFGQALEQGIQKGWIIISINGKKYSFENLVTARESHYSLTFGFHQVTKKIFFPLLFLLGNFCAFFFFFRSGSQSILTEFTQKLPRCKGQMNDPFTLQFPGVLERPVRIFFLIFFFLKIFFLLLFFYCTLN